MMANSTDQVQLKQLVFELAWETRDEIIGNLNQHTKLLSGLTIKPEAREKLRKANGDLIVVLLNLPLKVDDSKSRRDAPKNELLLDLNWETRSRIVDTLMANHQIALLESNSVVGQFKSKLIYQNNELSCELLKLTSRSISNGDHANDQTTKTNGRQESKVLAPTRCSPRINRIVKQELVERPVERPVEQPVEHPVIDQVASSPTVDRGLKRKLDEPREELENEIRFTFKLKGVDALLASGTKKSRSSLRHNCRGIPWYLNARLSVVDGTEYLSIYLHYQKVIDDARWRVKASYEIRLQNWKSGSSDVIRVGKEDQFEKPSLLTGWGWDNFISVRRLSSGSFIQNDTIKIRAHLKILTFESFTD